MSLSYLDYDGIVKSSKDSYQRITAQFNASYKIKSWLEVGTTNSIERVKLGTISEGSISNGAALSTMYVFDPLTPVTYEDGIVGASSLVQNALNNGYEPMKDPESGNYFGTSYWVPNFGNPIAEIYKNTNTDKRFRVNGTFYANIEPVKNLIVTSRLGYRLNNTRIHSYTPAFWAATESYAQTLMLSEEQRALEYLQWENFVNYNFSLKKNDFSIMAGTSYIDYTNSNVLGSTDAVERTLPNYLYLDYSTTSANDLIQGNEIRNSQLAYFGRIGWSYDNRYNIQVNFRADAYDNSKLDKDNAWGYFPSVSAGWTLSEEQFMKGINSDILSQVKLRASYGKNGSISNLGNYMYASSLLTGNYYYTNNQLYTGVYPSQFLANPELRWEESVQFDAGLDVRLFKSKLSMSLDYYDKNTDGLLIQSVAPLTTGTNYVFQNVGVVNNKGFEFDLEWNDKIGKDLRYGLKGNIAFLSNKVTEYKGEGVRIDGAKLGGTTGNVTFFEEGHSVWYLRGYKVTGIDSDTGAPIYADLDNSGTITENDKTDIGSAIPDFTYGVTFTASYKNFDLLVLGSGASGGKLMYAASWDNKPEFNRPKFLYDERWTSDNPNAPRPSALYQTDAKYLASDAMVFDASYFKIKQIQLGYNIPQKLLQKINVMSLRAFVSLDDFFVFTKYPGQDPEVRSALPNAMAIDPGRYPATKTVMFGINLSF